MSRTSSAPRDRRVPEGYHGEAGPTSPFGQAVQHPGYNVSDPTILASIDRMVDEARTRYKAEYGHLDEEVEYDPESSVEPNLAPPAISVPNLDDTLPIAQRLPSRTRRAPKGCAPVMSIDTTATTAAHDLLCDTTIASIRCFLSARDDPHYYLDT
jgi:hypothetical protein